jgi:hypothetical protein
VCVYIYIYIYIYIYNAAVFANKSEDFKKNYRKGPAFK